MLRGTRVAVVNWRDLGHSLAGGSERYAWEFALGLREAGAEVDFLTARDTHQTRDEVVDGIRVRRRGGRFGFYPAIWAYLFYRRFRRGYDVVIDAENGIPVFAPLVVPRSTALVLVMHHVHQEQFRTYFPRPLADVGRFLERRAMPRVYRDVRTLAVSVSTHREMIAQLGWHRPVKIVPNGAVPPAPPTSADRIPPDSTDRIVVLGRLATHKRIDLVVRAVADLLPTRPGLRLDIVGRGPEEPVLRALVEELGVGDRVTLHGFLSEDDKHAVLLSSRLHVCASDAEGWGQVVIEAASYGIPTLARRVPGLRDSIRDGETGWLVEDHGGLDRVPEQLETGICDALDFLGEDGRRADMAEACRTWASGFTWERMHEQVQTVVSEELKRSRGGQEQAGR